MNTRRGFFKTLLGVAATIAAPALIPAAKVLPPRLQSLLMRGFPLLISRDLIGVHPMTGPTGTIFYMNLVKSDI